MAKIYVSNAGCQNLFGVTGKFKVNQCIMTVRRDRKITVLHLGKAKPQMSTVLAYFSAVINGTRFSGTEFLYEDMSKTLSIQSVSGIGGIIAAGGPTYAIPISYIPNQDRVLCTNIYPGPNYLASGA